MEMNFKETEVGKIPSNWEIKELGEDIELVYGKGLTEKKRAGGDVPVFGSNGMVGHHNELLVKGPGIIVGRKGTVGEVKFSRVDFWPIDTTYYVKLKHQGSMSFWYYFLSSLKLNRLNSHSAVPGLNRDQVYQIIKSIPPYEEQCTIAKILYDLDSKIALNNRMNKTLEEMAQAIFKHWFVDFEFPDENGKPYKSSGGKMVYSEELGKEIPEGWDIQSLDKIANFLNGLALQKYPPKDEKDYLPVIKIRELKQGISENSDKAASDIKGKYVVMDGDVLFSWSGSLDIVLWCGGKGALNQHLFKVTSESFPKWFYYFWIKEHLHNFQHIAAGKATTMGHIQRHHLSESFVVIPSNRILENGNNLLEPIFKQLVENNLVSRNLTNMRDALLPKLMSGQIRVNNDT